MTVSETGWMGAAEPDWTRTRTLTLGRLRLRATRVKPEANPLLMAYPLIGKRGLLLVIWRRRLEFRW